MDLALRTGRAADRHRSTAAAHGSRRASPRSPSSREIFRRNVAASGVIPQISLILGPSAGGAVYSPRLTDFVVMADGTSNMFITGPDVIRAVTGEDVGLEELGGAHTHNERSGVAHYLASDEDDALDYVRTLLSFLPDNNLAELPVFDSDGDLEITDEDRKLNTLIPDSPNQPYDMKTVIEHVVDDGDFLEVQPLYAPNIVIGFGRVEGHPVGIVANQPNCTWPAPWTSTPPRRPRGSCGPATRSTSRS